MSDDKRLIIFFDGVCSLCNGVVDFLLRHDKKDLFRFAPLQGKVAKEILLDADVQELSSLIVHHDGVDLKKFRGVMLIVKSLGLPFSLLYVFSVVPNFIGDGLYSLIAKNRYNLFGKRETCRLPTPEERSKFLD